MKKLILKSPAKLNLYLRVINKRQDGYHNLKMIFERIDLCDELSFTENSSGKIKIICNHPHVPTGPKNLVFKVARLLQEKYGVSKGVTVNIDKRIPVAAGLAGGSSNAATALKGLNRVWGLKLSQKQLLVLGNQLGSDIAFFLHNCSWALGEGRGEKITKLDISKKYWHILVTPKVKMYTPKVYNSFNLKTLTNKKDNANILIHYLKKGNIDKIILLLLNNLDQSIVSIAPNLQNVVGRMEAFGVKGVSFSGSGPSVFGIIQSRQEAQHLCDLLRRSYSQVFVVTTR